ncbi:HpcH/HpaI aldolase/citrate lyase family protein [Delftia sp. RIT313]|uniref:HpcH/HpaI aldolase/citrate lyase family protein n=1 Tax=Delftia sp. RIT313 TaxID=1468410 RepID=UPI000447D344|nr:CoA ester lyase [Delftia sp. RIT313]EZP56317.1 Citrate (Pro-3S)-lyase [Delftia sp. RIT313]
MRSKLFVPASRPELFAKALAGDADALSFDLEDAVAEARKDEARGLLRSFLLSPESRGHGKTLIVRVNAMDTPHFGADIAEMVRDGVHLINLPKPETVQQVREAAQRIAEAADANGVAQAPGLLLNIETPRALRCAVELASAHASVAGLQMGLGDLFEPFGVNRREPAAIAQALFAVRMAAAEAGVYAYDGAFADIRDSEGFSAEARLSRGLGFLGKTCIHPSQIALANAVYQPTEQEIGHALKVVEAARQADANALGAYVVDGKMVDKPFVLRAQAIVAAAHAQGLLAA